MSPEFGLTLETSSSKETVHNFRRLAERFAEGLEIENNQPIIHNKKAKDFREYLEIDNSLGEVILIYPKTGDWRMYKEADLREEIFEFFDNLSLLVYKNQKLDYSVLMIDNSCSEARKYPLVKDKLLDRFYFGKKYESKKQTKSNCFREDGRYENAKVFLGNCLNLYIEDFYIEFIPEIDDSKNETMKNGILEISLDLK
jgi:hypothetical protein